MSSLDFARLELDAAMERGVRQCVVIGATTPLSEELNSSLDREIELFTLSEEEAHETAGHFVPTQFGSEELASALEKTRFDKLKASLFVWVGGASYRTVDAVLSTLAFIASLPRGSSVVFDYAPERSSMASLSQTALDALASRVCETSGNVKHVVQPQAVAAMLRGLGFQKIIDLAREELPGSGGHLVSAVV